MGDTQLLNYSGFGKQSAGQTIISSVSYQVPTSTTEENQPTPTELESYLKSESFIDLLRQQIKLMSEQEENNDIDNNPFDDIIVNELTKILGFRRLSKSKVQDALTKLSDNQEQHLIFSNNELLILLDQSKELELITDEFYEGIKDTPNLFYINAKEAYQSVLEFQMTLPNNIPTVDEIKLAGIDQWILKLVNENPDVVVDESLIETYTDRHIEAILLRSSFIGYTQCSRILGNPESLLYILGKDLFYKLFKRVQGYLPFITDEKIEAVLKLLPSNYEYITNYFSKEEIRAVIDKELDIKNLILKTLSIEEVQAVFNKLKSDFETDFRGEFNQSFVEELIRLNLSQLFPNDNIVLNSINTLYGGTITEEEFQNFINQG